jgi:hypothetical protein
MPSIVNLLIAVIAAAVVLWLLSYVVPGFIAALIALLVFVVLAFGGLGFGGYGRYGGRVGPGTRY